MTLTEMLAKEVKHPEPIKEIFKQWLKEIALGAVQDDAMTSLGIRIDLITMVDEP